MSGSSVALGFFDGVHIAHQKIITSAVNFAEVNGLSPVALTFDKSPAELLSSEKVYYLTSNEEKVDLIKSLGASTQFLNLDASLLSLSPEEFVKNILVDKLKTSHAVCGYNYHFGKGGSGNTDILKKLGEKYDFTVNICDEITYQNTKVSSSNIRALLKEGNINLANILLGRKFSLSGTVTEGKHLGSKLGFPTANVFFRTNSAVPLCGVYKTVVNIDGKKYSAITNVGINPTVGGEKMRSETYIPNFSKDIYKKEITVEFIDFIRKETKFESIDLLKKQIEKDISQL